jgi:hypothetical protein
MKAAASVPIPKLLSCEACQNVLTVSFLQEIVRFPLKKINFYIYHAQEYASGYGNTKWICMTLADRIYQYSLE